MAVNDSWNIPISKLMYWKGCNWVNFENKSPNLCLKVHCNQLLVVDNKNVLETLNMSGKIKGIYKEDVLILIVCSHSQEIRKFKFKVKSNALQHFKKLGEHFIVVSHNNSATKTCNTQYRKVEDVFMKVLDDYNGNASINTMPNNYKSFVELCLLDPMFPQIVHETQKIIETQILKKTAVERDHQF